MSIKVAINGYGRIGRNIMRAVHEYGWLDRIEIVAINDLGDAATNAHLTKYDTAHGTFAGDVSVEGGDLVVGDDGFAGTVVRIATSGVRVHAVDACGGVIVTVAM